MILRDMQHDLVIGCSSDRSATDYVLQICVCLCVCVSISCEPDIAKSYERILMQFFGEVGHDQGTKQLDFGGNLDSFVDPGSYSRILYR